MKELLSRRTEENENNWTFFLQGMKLFSLRSEQTKSWQQTEMKNDKANPLLHSKLIKKSKITFKMKLIFISKCHLSLE